MNSCLVHYPETVTRFDSLAKEALKGWPHASVKLWQPSLEHGAWLRAQPVDGSSTGPRLVQAGSNALRTQPDGLWVFISSSQGFADCIAIEACSTGQNFNDKRSRYNPSTVATVLHCPWTWLCGSIPYTKGHKARWELTEGLQSAPAEDKTMPVRFLRVLFFLKDELYASWRPHGIPAGHEYIASYSSIKSYTAPAMQNFLRRMSLGQHFYKKS